jgi:cytoskeletal protein CcmA (bactofilin family)
MGYTGTISGSSNANIGGTLKVAKNKFQVASDGDLTAVAGTFSANLAAVAGTFSGNISGSDAVQAGSLSIGGGVMAVTTAGNINLGAAIFSASYGSNLTASRAEFAPFGTSANRSLSIDSGGLAMLDSSGDDSFEVTYAGVVSGSNALKGLSLALHGASIASDGDLAAVAGTFTGAISGSSTLSVAGNVQLDGADDAVAFVVADSMYFRDAGTGQMRRDSWSDIMGATAGDGITNTGGVLSVEGNQNIDIDTVGNASRQLTAAGMNYATASITTDVTYTLPATPSTGDIVYIKLAAVTSGKHAVISGSGMQLIDGVSTLTASSPYAGISLCYVASDVWRVF